MKFLSFRLESPIHAPKILVFGEFYPQNLGAHHSNPQKAHSCVICAYIIYYNVLCGDKYLGIGAADCHKILHDGTYMSRAGLLPLWVQYPQGPENLKFWAFIRANISKMISRSVTCQLGFDISSTGAF